MTTWGPTTAIYWSRAASCLRVSQGPMRLTCPVSDQMMCAICMPCQRVPMSSIPCARRETYTGVVELVGFDHGSVVSFKTWKWCADMKVLSIHKLCAMKRVLVGVHVNNAATNKTWKPRHDHGTSPKLWNGLPLSLRTREIDLGRGTALLCIAPAITAVWAGPFFYKSHLSYRSDLQRYKQILLKITRTSSRLLNIGT
jgi:hypothetical protein